MKDLSLLVWLGQLGLSVAVPLAGFILLGVWLHEGLGWGQWTIWAGIVLGLWCAITGFRGAIKSMDLMVRDKKNQDSPPISFNEHN